VISPSEFDELFVDQSVLMTVGWTGQGEKTNLDLEGIKVFSNVGGVGGSGDQLAPGMNGRAVHSIVVNHMGLIAQVAWRKPEVRSPRTIGIDGHHCRLFQDAAASRALARRALFLSSIPIIRL
jgi:hypothetical protein